MLKKNNIVLTVTALLGIALVTWGLFKKSRENVLAPISLQQGKNVTTGAEDRIYWADLLYRIAYPVVHNLAEGTLKKNMPLETSEGYIMHAADVSHLEALGNTMAGVAPWLSLPDDETPEGKKRKALRNDLLKAIANAVNPSSPDYLNFRTGNQPIIDVGAMSHGFLRAYDALWVPLDAETKKRVIAEFKSLRDRSGPDNNWVFLAAIREAFLMKAGEPADMERIKLALDRIPKWYKGDGWYSDGNEFSMDYFNSYVLHSVIVDILKVTTEKGLSSPAEFDQVVKRMARQAEFLERVVSPEGTYPVFGRAVTYRTAVFQALSHAALLEKLPEHLEPAQARSAMTAVMHNLFDHPRNFDGNGWLVLGFNGRQPLAADVYTSTGSLYMCAMGFVALGLPPSSRFWSDPAADWTSKRAWGGAPFKRDYRVAY
jgi:hypothetical protein